MIEAPKTVLGPVKTPFESVKRSFAKVRVEDIEMECAPEASDQVSKLAGKRRLLDSESERDSVIIEVPSDKFKLETRLFHHESLLNDRAAQVEHNIRARQIAFKKVSPLTCNKPSDKETMEYLKRMGINTGFAKSSLRSGIPRPCFNPNG